MAKKIKIVAALVIALITVFSSCVSIFAMVPYKTYSYNRFGMYFLSPDAFEPELVVDSTTMGIGERLHLDAVANGADEEVSIVTERLTDPTDIFVDVNDNVYIAESGKNRIIILDSDLKCTAILSEFVNSEGETDYFNKPTGVFVTKDGLLYVADSKNQRIVIFDEDLNFVDILPPPEADVLPSGFVYEPYALSVDVAGKIYVVARSTNMGLVALNADGSFDGFVGATRTTQSVLGFLMELIQSKEQKARTNKSVPTEYNNITIDDKGFLYVTTSALDKWRQFEALASSNKETTNAPIKRLNSIGSDILKRNGFFPPAGDVQVESGEITKFIDVSVTVNNTYSVLDATKNRIFTYDDQGRFLYAFGGTGTQNGVFQSVVGLAYQFNGEALLVLDSATGKVTRFKRTAYGDAIANAIDLQMNRRYDESEVAWREILKQNSSLDIAYTGIGLSRMRMDDYTTAMENFRIAWDWDNYFKAAGEQRKVDGRIYLFVIPAVVIALLFLISKFLAYANKVNRTQLQGKKATLWQEFLYGFHIIFHPFDGFWDLRYEKRGGVRGALLIIAIIIISNIFSVLFSGYAVYEGDWREVNFTVALPLLLPLLLWCISNWSLTTLMDGKGKMSDIFIASSYALMPLALFTIPTAIFSNFILRSEIQFVTFFNTFTAGWMFILMFVGALVTNSYGFLKNLVTSALSVFGMAFMAFLSILFINLMTNIITFANTIISEITFRM